MPIRDWFRWNGVLCTNPTYGIRVTELPPPAIPEMRSTFTDVPGRSGSLTMIEGTDVFKDIQFTAKCAVQDLTTIPAIARWLTDNGGAGIVEFANRPGGVYEGRVINQTNFTKRLRGHDNQNFNVVFRCQPFWTKYQPTQSNPLNTVKTVTASRGGRIAYSGTVFGLPKITVTAVNSTTPVTFTLTLGVVTVAVTGMVGGIVIDSQYQEAYWNNTPKNSQISCGEFPKLQNGSAVNTINWTQPASIASVKVEFEERYL